MRPLAPLTVDRYCVSTGRHMAGEPAVRIPHRWTGIRTDHLPVMRTAVMLAPVTTVVAAKVGEFFVMVLARYGRPG